MTIISFLILSGVCLNDLNREIIKVRTPQTINISKITTNFEMRSGGVMIEAAIRNINPTASIVEIFMSLFSELWFDTPYTLLHYKKPNPGCSLNKRQI